MKRYSLTLASDPKLREAEKQLLNIAADIGMIIPLPHSGKQGEMVFRTSDEAFIRALQDTLADMHASGGVVEQPEILHV